MSVIAKANRVVFYLWNTDRQLANPPVVFPDITPISHFSSSIWTYVTNNIPTGLYLHNCKNGSYILIQSDGHNWYLICRVGSVIVSQDIIAPVTLWNWACFCVAKDGPLIQVYHGVENVALPDNHTHPVTLTHKLSVYVNIDDAFNDISLITHSNNYISNFKFWNSTLTLAQFQEQANTFDTTGNPAPMWSSTLRTPGDLSNIVNPNDTQNWSHGHAFSQIFPLDSLLYGGDQAFMANTTPCSVWLYPIGVPVCSYNLVTPSGVAATYKAEQFWEFHDRGSIPPIDSQIQSITYYGVPSNGLQSDTWPLYKDENGVEISPDFGNPANRFEQDSGVLIPGLKASTVFLWKYGAQFTFQSGISGNATLSNLLLLVTFIGYPTAVPQLPANDLAGLFAIKKGGLVDRFNRGVELKIPDPTIRTAFIGE
jgi:hypothetical protein